MKILHVVPALGEVYGGPSKSVRELTQALTRSGIRVDLVTTNANGASQIDVPFATWISSSDVSIQYFPYKLGEYKFSWSMTHWLYRHIREYDLVHIHAIYCYPSLPSYWECWWHRIPYIVSPRGMLEPWAMESQKAKKALYYSLCEKPGLERASALHMLAVSEAENTKYLGLNPPQVVIPNGIHRSDFESLPTTELFYQRFPALSGKQLILFLGRIDPKKGLDLLAQAFAHVHQQFLETHLVIAGPDNIGFLPTVQQYFSDIGCLEAVTFTGMLTGNLKMSALTAANIYVAPSYSEGFSMSVLEGMASGLPCVITTGCNFPEAGKAGAAHVVNIDSAEIADALLACLRDSDAAKAMGERARQFIFEYYTWDKIAVMMRDVYEAILTNQPLPAYRFASDL